MGWLPWVLLALGVLALLWFLFLRHPADPAPVAAVSPSDQVVVPNNGANAMMAANSSAAAAMPAVAIPDGAGVTTETRAGKPVVNVYFTSIRKCGRFAEIVR